MDFLKTVGGKVVGGLVAVVVIVLVITFLRMDAGTRSAVFGGTGKVLGWLMIVALVPWATFFVIKWVDAFESNLAGGLLVFAYTALEVVLLAYLFDWQIYGAARWTFLGLGGLVAGVYNLFLCDWLAERVA